MKDLKKYRVGVIGAITVFLILAFLSNTDLRNATVLGEWIFVIIGGILSFIIDKVWK